MKMLCSSCGHEVEIVERVEFRQSCQACGAWLHSCVHCRFWSGNNCTETSAERIGNPEAQNFCEWYKEGAQSASADAKAMADKGQSAEKGGDRASAEELWEKLTGKKP